MRSRQAVSSLGAWFESGVLLEASLRSCGAWGRKLGSEARRHPWPRSRHFCAMNFPGYEEAPYTLAAPVTTTTADYGFWRA